VSRALAAMLALGLIVAGAAGCGAPRGGMHGVPPAAAQHPAAEPLPRIPGTAIASIEYVKEDEWRIIPPVGGALPSVHQALEHVATMLRIATPVPIGSLAPSEPGGLIVDPPTATSIVEWIVAFNDGARITVMPNVMRCPGKGTCQPDDDYALLDHIPAQAPGLISALQSLTDASPPPVTPVTVTPPDVTRGGSLVVSGDGWVGATVTLTVQQCGAVPEKTWSLGSAAVHGGQFHWSGHLPGDVPLGSCSLQASDAAHSAAAGPIVQ